MIPEKWVYTIVVSFLLGYAVFLPIIIIQSSKLMPHVHLSPYNSGITIGGEEKTSFPIKYFSYNELEDYLNEFVSTRGIIFSKRSIGTVNNYKISEIILRKKGQIKPKILIVSGLATSDWSSVLTTIQIMHNFFTDPFQTSTFLNSYNFHFLPLLLPEDYSDSQPDTMFPAKKVSLLYQFKEDEITSESRIFTDYFRSTKSDIKAMFFLFSPKVRNYTNGVFTVSDKIGNCTTANVVIKELAASLASTKHFDFEYTKIDKQNFEGRIDQWVLNETQPTPVLVVNVMHYYGIQPPDIFQNRIKEFGDDAFFLITEILNKIGYYL